MTLLRCLLALVFAAAAAGKLIDQHGFRTALADFGAPARSVTPLALAIPVFELIVAALLVPAETAQPAAWAALGLLLLFSGAVARAISRGESPDCGCFGSRATPVGPRTLARNALLGAAAVAVAALGPGDSLTDAELSGEAAFALVVSLCLTGLAAVSWQLFRQNGRLLERVRALEAHALANEIDERTPRRSQASGVEHD